MLRMFLEIKIHDLLNANAEWYTKCFPAYSDCKNTVHNGKNAVIQKVKQAVFCRNIKCHLNTERLSCILNPTAPCCYKECRTVT
jgi:hypothetical protein